MHHLAKGPFPLPFKGKGEEFWRSPSLRRRLDEAQGNCREIEQAMQALIDEYEQTFSTPLSAYLTLHRTGNGLYVRWRMAGTRQSYFSLATNEIGKVFYGSLSPAVRQVIFDFEQRRLRLNLMHGMVMYESRALQRFMAEVRASQQLRNET